MIHLKFFPCIISILILPVCSEPDNNANPSASSYKATDAYDNTNGNSSNKIWGVWAGGNISSAEMENYPFVRGWYVIYQWKKLEPQKDNFDWNYFDNQLKFAIDHNLSIGFMVWAGPHCPDWLYANGVPQVSTTTKAKMSNFPFYLNATYKERYYNMLKQVANHLSTLPAEQRNKIVMWMSAEGSTGDITPYKGFPNDSRYAITDEQWFQFKKDVWTYLYKICQSARPRINLLINQGNGGQYFNWLQTNLPNVWMKAGNISHTYQFNGELEYYNRLKKLDTKIAQDSSSSRLRGEITLPGKWFNQNESWNMYALLTSALHFGLDIFNAGSKYFQNPIDSISFNFFDFYAGEKVANKSPGAFCVFRDGLDAADIKRFPESVYGPVVDPAKMDAYQHELQRKNRKDLDNDNSDDGDDGSDEGINESNIKNDNLSAKRVNKILEEFASYGAKRSDLNDADSADTGNDPISENENHVQRNPNKQPRNPNRIGKNPNKPNRAGKNKPDEDEKGTAYQRKREANMVINDVGVNLIPDNYYRFLTQYSPNTTSHGYWRVGPADQPYGRFARGFDTKKGMNEMFFSLDKDFFNGSTTAKHVAVKIIYFDQGNGQWSLNYYNGSTKKEAYNITCSNSGRWITKIIALPDAYFTQKLEHNCDLSIKYLAGDNTIFNSIEVLRQ